MARVFAQNSARGPVELFDLNTLTMNVFLLCAAALAGVASEPPPPGAASRRACSCRVFAWCLLAPVGKKG